MPRLPDPCARALRAWIALGLSACVSLGGQKGEDLFDPDGDGADWPSDCDNADDAVYPGAPEVCDDGVVNDCAASEEDALTACGRIGTRSLADARRVFTGERAGDHAGIAIASVGDVDGDGQVALLIGSYPTSGDDDAGAAYLLRDPGAGEGALSLSEADLTLQGARAGDLAGYVLAGAGDVDGDGLADLLVGAGGDDEADDGAGAVVLLLGGGALRTTKDRLSLAGGDLTLTGERADDLAGGRAIVGGLDVDGDGRADAAISARPRDEEGDWSGVTYLALGDGALGAALDAGQASQSLAAADLRIDCETPGDFAGYALSSAGDVDGDGQDDLLVSALYESTGGFLAGAVYLLLSGGALAARSGATLGLADSDLKLIGEAAGDTAGSAMAAAGDVDGDGAPELLIGAYTSDAGATNSGAAYLMMGGGALERAIRSGDGSLSLAEAELRIDGEAADDQFGRSLAGAGDVDGDGRSDLILGSADEDSAAPGAGMAWLWLGGGALAGRTGTLAAGAADLRLSGEAEDDNAAYVLSGAGDVNQDGFDDLLIGAWNARRAGAGAGAAYLVLGGRY